jgi:hypothetical protein
LKRWIEGIPKDRKHKELMDGKSKKREKGEFLDGGEGER